MPYRKMVQQNLLNNLKICAKYWKTKKMMIIIQNKYNGILFLSDKHLYVLYHKATGFQTSRGKGKH